MVRFSKKKIIHFFNFLEKLSIQYAKFSKCQSKRNHATQVIKTLHIIDFQIQTWATTQCQNQGCAGLHFFKEPPSPDFDIVKFLWRFSEVL
jgi:hypothetical protein